MKRFILIVLLFISFNSVSKNRHDWIYTSLKVTYITLNASDYFLTLHALNNGGVELNPIVKPFADNPILLGVYKATFTGFMLFYCDKMFDLVDPWWAKGSLIFANTIYGLVVYHNISVSLTLKF